jgi:type III secretion control protein HpaP
VSNPEVKRPQRIWSAEELGVKPAAPPKPARVSTSNERFHRLLLSQRLQDSAGESMPPRLQVSVTPSARKSEAASQTEEGAAAPKVPVVAVAPAPSVQPAGAPAAATSWSWTLPEHNSHQEVPSLEEIKAQRWPDDIAHAAETLCRRAGNQFTGWRVAVPVDPEALPETELWLEASPQRLLLRFRTLSAWSVRLICVHQERLLSLLRRRIGASREVELEIT